MIETYVSIMPAACLSALFNSTRKCAVVHNAARDVTTMEASFPSIYSQCYRSWTCGIDDSIFIDDGYKHYMNELFYFINNIFKKKLS